MHYELTEEEKFYRNALTRMPDGPVALEESYSAVMGIVTEVEQYVKVRRWFHSGVAAAVRDTVERDVAGVGLKGRDHGDRSSQIMAFFFLSFCLF